MRGRGLMYSIITYIIAMTVSTSLILLIKTPSLVADAGMELLSRMRETGELIYFWITGIQFLLVLVLAPAITAGLTTTEKERKTFDFLRVTTITRWMYIMGCFLSTTFYVLLALICALPLLSLSFLYGGVALMDVVSTFFLLLTCSCLLSSIGLFVSSITERTRSAQGIIIFLIFTLFFIAIFLYSQFQVLFSGAMAQAGMEEPGSDAIYIFDIPFAPWVLTCLALVALSGLFLLLAARKLFDPEESRALSHWQFVVIYAVACGGVLGLLATNAFQAELAEILFLIALYSLLVAAIFSFAMGRMEVGDEIWHLKRLVPVLRPIDQTIPFLALLCLSWWFVLRAVPEVALASQLESAFLDTFLYLSAAAFIFFCVTARAVTALCKTRRLAMVTISLIAVLLFVIFPIMASAFWVAMPRHSFFFGELVALSPFALAVDGIFNMSRYEGTGMPIGKMTLYFYLGAAVVVALVGETARYRRWKNYDYHFDMPTG